MPWTCPIGRSILLHWYTRPATPGTADPSVPLLDGWGIAFIAVALLVGLVLHEFMHAATANAFGDPTAREAGRLTLNPIRHIDPFGTVILPGLLLVLAATGTGSGAVFGYAKPVPAPRRLRGHRRRTPRTAPAGVVRIRPPVRVRHPPSDPGGVPSGHRRDGPTDPRLPGPGGAVAVMRR